MSVLSVLVIANMTLLLWNQENLQTSLILREVHFLRNISWTLDLQALYESLWEVLKVKFPQVEVLRLRIFVRIVQSQPEMKICINTKHDSELVPVRRSLIDVVEEITLIDGFLGSGSLLNWGNVLEFVASSTVLVWSFFLRAELICLNHRYDGVVHFEINMNLK